MGGWVGHQCYRAKHTLAKPLQRATPELGRKFFKLSSRSLSSNNDQNVFPGRRDGVPVQERTRAAQLAEARKFKKVVPETS